MGIIGFIELSDKTTNIDKKLDQLNQQLRKVQEKEGIEKNRTNSGTEK